MFISHIKLEGSGSMNDHTLEIIVRILHTIYMLLQIIFPFIHFASAVVAVDSGHMTVSSSASWSSVSPPSHFVCGHMSTMWFMSVAGHNHRKVIGQDHICANLHDMGLCLSGNG